MKRAQKVTPGTRKAGPVFTLDRDGGLVVSRKVLLKEGVMRRQLDATKHLFERDQLLRAKSAKRKK